MCQFINLPFGRIGTFSLCVGLGLLVLVLIVLHNTMRSGIAPSDVNERFIPALPFCMLFGVLFAGFTDLFFHDGIVAACQNPLGRGVNYFGWLVGCPIFLFVFGRLTRISAAHLYEIFIPACMPAQAIGRIGCFLGGCCYGIPVDSPWGVVYPEGSLPFSAYGTTPLLPVQLYEAAWLLAAFAVVMLCVHNGHRAGVSLIAMGFGRFAFEFLRGDSRGTFIGSGVFTPAQVFGFFFVMLGILLTKKPHQSARLSDRSEKICQGVEMKIGNRSASGGGGNLGERPDASV